MLLKKLFSSWLQQKTAYCEGIPTEELPDDKITMEEEEMLEEKSHYVPTYQMVMTPIKSLTMAFPGSEINGFKMSIGMPLSHNFLTSHVINMAPKKQQVSTGNPMMDMFNEKTAYYNLGVQYHHGDLLSKKPHLSYSLIGQINSAGKLDAMFLKSWRNFKFKAQSSFMNSNIMFSQSNFEVEYGSAHGRQVLAFSRDYFQFNVVEKLGNKFMLGLDFMYVMSRNMMGRGFLMRYSPRPTDKLYLNYSELSQNVTFGSVYKLNENTSVATELVYGGPSISEASFGYKTRSKNFEVNSSIKTTGEIKSIFTFQQAQMYKLRLFLGGNLFVDDFKSGFSLSIGQTED